jgi:hypothetical protein
MFFIIGLDPTFLVSVLAVLVTFLLGFQIYKTWEYELKIKDEQRKIEELKNDVNGKIDGIRNDAILFNSEVDLKLDKLYSFLKQFEVLPLARTLEKIYKSEEYKKIVERVALFNENNKTERAIKYKLNHTATEEENFYVIAFIEPVMGWIGNEFFKVTEFKYDIENDKLTKRKPETGEFESVE